MTNRITDSFDRLVTDEPSRLLIHAVSEGRELTAASLRDEAQAIRTVLARAGLSRGDAVMSQASNRAAFIGLVIACFELEVAIVPVDRSVPPAEVRSLANRFGAAGLVLPHSTTPDAGETVFVMPGGLALHCRAGNRTDYSGTAILKVTSGSTGLPKATATSIANVWSDTQAIVESMDIRPDDIQLGVLPLSHAYGFGNLVGPLLCQGTTLVLRHTFVPSQTPDDVARFGIRVMPGVPFIFEHMLGTLPPSGIPPPLEILITAGAPIAPSTVARFHERFGLKIHSFYGTTETGGIAYDGSPDVDAEVTVGRAMPNVTIALRQEDTAPGGAGRVHVTGPAVASGYAGDALSQGDGFVDGGFLTGDLGFFDERGRLNLAGRVSTFVNVAGQKVQPAEVERTVREFPGVRDVRVVGAADPRRGQVLVACVIADAATVRTAALREFCAARLSPHKIPREFVFLDALPVDLRGKPDRHAIEAEVTRHLSKR